MLVMSACCPYLEYGTGYYQKFVECRLMEERVMTNLISKDPKEIVAEHIEMLRAYAVKVITNGEQLTVEESDDKADRFHELQVLCSSFDVTEREMVTLVLKHAMSEPKRCGCPTCRARMGLTDGEDPTRKGGFKL